MFYSSLVLLSLAPLTRSQTRQIPSDVGSVTLLHQSVSQLNGISDRLVEVEAIVKKVSGKLGLLDASINNKDGLASADNMELKRQLDIMFTKIENIGYDIGGFNAKLEYLQNNMDFIKKGYSGVFDIVANTVDSQQCNRGQPQSNRDSRVMVTAIQQLQASLRNYITLMEAIQTSIVSLNGKVEASNFQNRKSKPENEEERLGVNTFNSQIKYLGHLLEVISRSAKEQSSGGQSTKYPRDCSEVLKESRVNGVYKIEPSKNTGPVFVYCNMEYNFGGWTVIQNRYGGQIEFQNRNMEEYRIGFGNVAHEYWLGLDSVHALTEESEDIFELRIEITDFRNKTAIANYAKFGIAGRAKDYQISLLDGYSGTAGDSLMLSQGIPFRTQFPQSSKDLRCNQGLKVGGWWFPTLNCPAGASNLNGRYLTGHLSTELEGLGTFWGEFHGGSYSLERTRMMIRPRK